jgi:hypothetical protein
MRKRQRKGKAGEDKADLEDTNTKVNHEPTDQQLKEFIAKKKGKEITERVETFEPIEQAGVEKAKILQVSEEQPRKKMILSKMTEEEKEMFNARNEWIREQRRKASIEKILEKMGKNKYSGLIGQKINIMGELYEVKAIGRKPKDTRTK